MYTVVLRKARTLESGWLEWRFGGIFAVWCVLRRKVYEWREEVYVVTA